MKKINKIHFGIGVIILLLIGGGIFLFYQNITLKNELMAMQADIEAQQEVEKSFEALDVEAIRGNAGPSLIELFAEPDTLIKEAVEVVAENQPSIEVTPKVFDMGTISKAEGVATASFKIKNTGKGTLLLNYAFTSCGCTAAPIADDNLEPGESTTMEVTYDPNYYGPQYDLGKVSKTVTILSNDPKDGFYKVALQANVVP